MKYFMSIVWVILTISSVYLIYFQIQSKQGRSQPIVPLQLKTQCLKWSNPFSNQLQQQNNPDMYKYCVHCFKKKTILSQLYDKPLLEFKVNHLQAQNYQPAASIHAISLLKIKNPLDFDCQEYLTFVDIQKSQKTKGIVLVQDNNAKKIQNLMQLQIQHIILQQKGSKPLQFTANDYIFQQYIILQQINRNLYQKFPIYPSQARVNYYNKTELIKHFKTIIYYCIFAFIFISILIFILQKRRNGFFQNYQNILLSSILNYLLIYINFYNKLIRNYLPYSNLILTSVIWGIFVWNFLIKLDNVDKNSFNFNKVYYFLISLVGGAAFFISGFLGNRIPEMMFWFGFFAIYLIGYKVILRICVLDKKFQNDSTLSTVSFEAILILLLIQIAAIQHMLTMQFFNQVQIFRYGLILVTPIILVIMTYYQNDQKIQKFTQYVKNTLDQTGQIDLSPNNQIIDHSVEELDKSVDTSRKKNKNKLKKQKSSNIKSQPKKEIIELQEEEDADADKK